MQGPHSTTNNFSASHGQPGRKQGYSSTGYNWRNLDVKPGATLDETLKPQAAKSPRFASKNRPKVAPPLDSLLEKSRTSEKPVPLGTKIVSEQEF